MEEEEGWDTSRLGVVRGVEGEPPHETYHRLIRVISLLERKRGDRPNARPTTGAGMDGGEARTRTRQEPELKDNEGNRKEETERERGAVECCRFGTMGGGAGAAQGEFL